MKKKVKKIPKYYNGELAVGIPDMSNYKIQNRLGVAPPSSSSTISYSGNENWADMTSNQKSAAVSNAIGGGADLINMATSGQKVTAGTALGGIAKGAAAGAAFGPVGAIVGGAAGLVAGTTGSTNKVNYDSVSTDINDIKEEGSGILKFLGMSDAEMNRKANLVQNNNIGRIQTEQMRAKYAMNPYNPNGGMVMAAEGGIMRKPVDALVSKGELIYDPTTKKLRQVPGSKGKPNRADDVFARLYEGDVVISNSPTMLMANGKTPAQNLMGMVDKYATGGTVKAREAIIKKVVNWQEANKTKPQEYAMYGDGTGEEGVENKPIKKRRNSIWNKLQDKWNASAVNDWLENYYNDIDKYEDHTIIDGRLFIKHDGKWYDSHKGGLGRAIKGNVLPESGKGYMTDRYQTVPFKQGVFADVDKSKIVKHKKNNTAVSDIVKPNSNNGNTTNTELDFVSFRHVNPDYDTTKSDIATNDIDSTITESKKGTVGKPSSSKKTTTSRVTTSTAPQEEKLTPEQIAESLRIADIGERHWLRGSVTEPKQSFASLAKITPEKIKSQGVNNASPLTGIKPLTDTTGTDNTGYTGSNWKDNLYRMAVLSQPLWDRAKAEPVNYESPVYKYMPTQIDVSSQLRDTDQSYALSRYNFANLYPNTGAGMAAGLQAASNRAKQYADIRQWQTNAQNELIGKNVGIYNNWANEHARILNDVYNKSAQNRATARNINRQNRAAALSNFGTMLSDDKKMAMERMKFNILKPAIRSTYEDATANDLMNMYNSLFR